MLQGTASHVLQIPIASSYDAYITTEQLLSTIKELHSMQKNIQCGCSCQGGCTSLLAKAEDVLQSPATNEQVLDHCALLALL